eukprot:TRINITY_DN2750_c0_g1_i1.p2 TRINITY_DN2750_c0_g1~~TRINITY_DN2750_c0_g1_i1.p2  ORF type:complete len:170 (-),score=17.30 TRINITY_DN2750_c0_g1_i1:240-749(-)
MSQILIRILVCVLIAPCLLGYKYKYDNKWEVVKSKEERDEKSKANQIDVSSGAQLDVTRNAEGFVDAFEDLFATSNRHFGFGFAKLRGAAYSTDTNQINANTAQQASNAQFKDGERIGGTDAQAQQNTRITNSNGKPVFLDQLNIVETAKGLTKFIGCTTNAPHGGCHR